MTDAPKGHSPNEINRIFAQLDPRDVEQFYANYQLWTLQQHIAEVQAQIQSIAQHIADNQAHLQGVYPSAIALATLARLQANGVSDIDLLDRMLERGEDWLDCTMQRLAYCEKFDFIYGNYTDWCEHALEGAYDWIDSVEEAHIENGPTTAPDSGTISEIATDAQDQTTEEMLLQKLMSDEDEATMLTPTLEAATQLSTLSSVEPSEDEDIQVQVDDISAELIPLAMQADHPATMEEIIPLEGDEATELPEATALPLEHVPLSEQIAIEEVEVPAPLPSLSDEAIHQDRHTSEDSEEEVSALSPTTPEETPDIQSTPLPVETPEETPDLQPIPISVEIPIADNDRPWVLEEEEEEEASPSATDVPAQHPALDEPIQSADHRQDVRSQRKRSLMRRLFTTFFSRL